MEISTEVTEVKSYEPIDTEPYHYIALVRYANCGNMWSTFCVYPMTSKSKLEESIRTSSVSYEEVRIIKIRLPIK